MVEMVTAAPGMGRRVWQTRWRRTTCAVAARGKPAALALPATQGRSVSWGGGVYLSSLGWRARPPEFDQRIGRRWWGRNQKLRRRKWGWLGLAASRTARCAHHSLDHLIREALSIARPVRNGSAARATPRSRDETVQAIFVHGFGISAPPPCRRGRRAAPSARALMPLV